MAELSELDDALARLSIAIGGNALQSCTDAAARPILKAVKQAAPNITGNLVSHINTVSSHTRSSASTAVQVESSGPGGDTREAIFLEYGTSKMAAKPFMRPAFDSTQQIAVAEFERQLNQKIKEFQ